MPLGAGLMQLGVWPNVLVPLKQRKVLEAVAATAKVNSLWVSNQSSPYEDYISWRYIATPTGVMRIYPGVQLASKDATTIKSAW